VNQTFFSPTEEEMRAALNETVGGFLGDQQRWLIGVGDVETVKEVKEYDCSPRITTFDTTVLVKFDVDVTSLSVEDIMALEANFAQTYNDQLFLNCDAPYFRLVTGVTLVKVSDDPQLVRQLFASRRAQALPSSLVFSFVFLRLTMECRDCPRDAWKAFTFMNDDQSRRTLTDDAASLGTSVVSIPVSQGLTGCFCPILYSDPHFRAPTEREFQVAFNETVGLVRDESSGSLLRGVGDVVEVVEVTEFDCSPNTTMFETAVLVELDHDPSLLTDEDLHVLEVSFLQTYNDLIFDNCDVPIFRRLLDVSMNRSAGPISSGGRQLTRRRVQLLPPAVNMLSLRLNITIGCQNCRRENTTLFDFTGNVGEVGASGSSRRSRALSNSAELADQGFGRQLQSLGLDACFCPTEYIDPWKVSSTDSGGIYTRLEQNIGDYSKRDWSPFGYRSHFASC
jgi:hypothetical protein